MVIFHCYVSSPEGKCRVHPQSAPWRVWVPDPPRSSRGPRHRAHGLSDGWRPGHAGEFGVWDAGHGAG